MQSQITQHADDSAPSGNDLRVARTKARIIAAVIECLDEVGYSETSINRVQKTAAVSRGALTHHFPTKEAMMVETLERLLDPVRGDNAKADDAIRHATGRGDGIAADMVRLWSKVLNTRPGRALVEILVAARTDATLRARIQPSLTAYNDQINANISALYQSAGDDDDIQVLWTICRTFLRGLHLQSRFEDNPAHIRHLLDRFARIMEPHMTARSQGTPD